MSFVFGKGFKTKLKSAVVKVHMLDDQEFSLTIDVKLLGRQLCQLVYDHFHIMESSYFGIEFVDRWKKQRWLEPDKPVMKQTDNFDFTFSVKFYMPDPVQLEDEYTRYLFALQIKRDLAQGVLLCSDNTAALLASYIVQAEIGDYMDDNGTDYLQNRRFFPNQTRELENRIISYHKNHVGQSARDADLNLLDIARKIELYGIHMKPAKDHEGVSLNLSVAHMGVLVFQNNTKINTFSWAKIRKICFKRKKFLIRLQPDSYGYYKDTVEFYFDTRDDCKCFWKSCIENHTFFRCSSTKQDAKRGLLTRGSSFRYNGLTLKETIENSREHFKRSKPFERIYSSQRRVAPQILPSPNRTDMIMDDSGTLYHDDSSTHGSRTLDSSRFSHDRSVSSEDFFPTSRRPSLSRSSHVDEEDINDVEGESLYTATKEICQFTGSPYSNNADRLNLYDHSDKSFDSLINNKLYLNDENLSLYQSNVKRRCKSLPRMHHAIDLISFKHLPTRNSFSARDDSVPNEWSRLCVSVSNNLHLNCRDNDSDISDVSDAKTNFVNTAWHSSNDIELNSSVTNRRMIHDSSTSRFYECSSSSSSCNFYNERALNENERRSEHYANSVVVDVYDGSDSVLHLKNSSSTTSSASSNIVSKCNDADSFSGKDMDAVNISESNEESKQPCFIRRSAPYFRNVVSSETNTHEMRKKKTDSKKHVFLDPAGNPVSFETFSPEKLQFFNFQQIVNNSSLSTSDDENEIHNTLLSPIVSSVVARALRDDENVLSNVSSMRSFFSQILEFSDVSNSSSCSSSSDLPKSRKLLERVYNKSKPPRFKSQDSSSSTDSISNQLNRCRRHKHKRP